MFFASTSFWSWKSSFERENAFHPGHDSGLHRRASVSPNKASARAGAPGKSLECHKFFMDWFFVMSCLSHKEAFCHYHCLKNCFRTYGCVIQFNSFAVSFWGLQDQTNHHEPRRHGSSWHTLHLWQKSCQKTLQSAYQLVWGKPLGIHPPRASQILPCKSAHFRLGLHILPSDKKCFKSLAETQNPVWGPPKAHHKWPRFSMPWKGQQVPACPHLQDSRIAEIAFIGGNQVAGPGSAHTTKQRTALQLPALLSHSPCNRQDAVLSETRPAGGREWVGWPPTALFLEKYHPENHHVTRLLGK